MKIHKEIDATKRGWREGRQVEKGGGEGGGRVKMMVLPLCLSMHQFSLFTKDMKKQIQHERYTQKICK